jgi:hypothetical protein
MLLLEKKSFCEKINEQKKNCLIKYFSKYLESLFLVQILILIIEKLN